MKTNFNSKLDSRFISGQVCTFVHESQLSSAIGANAISQGPLKQMDGIAVNGLDIRKVGMKPCKWLKFMSKREYQIGNAKIQKRGDSPVFEIDN